MTSREILSENLLQYRLDNQLSQEELAWESDLSVKGYSLVERGKVHASLKTMDKLSDATGISVPELLTSHT